MKTTHFLRHGLFIILFSARTFLVQAQTPLDVYVTTEDGQLMMDCNLQNGWLEVKSLNPGVYFIKVPEEDSSSSVCKLVILR